MQSCVASSKFIKNRKYKCTLSCTSRQHRILGRTAPKLCALLNWLLKNSYSFMSIYLQLRCRRPHQFINYCIQAGKGMECLRLQYLGKGRTDISFFYAQNQNTHAGRGCSVELADRARNSYKNHQSLAFSTSLPYDFRSLFAAPTE